jgi:hypothetical protein
MSRYPSTHEARKQKNFTLQLPENSVAAARFEDVVTRFANILTGTSPAYNPLTSFQFRRCKRHLAQ